MNWRNVKEAVAVKNNNSVLLLFCCLLASPAASASVDTKMPGMQSLSDDELSEMTGQALFNLAYLAPGEAKDANGALISSSSNQNIGFYNIGMEAELELNANIKNLQLGCGGVNNSVRPAACDIDIKNLSLSGLPSNFVSGGVNDGSPDYSADGGRAATSALLTNPFIEFAVKNPNSSTLREIVGARFGAAEILGMLTAGINNGTAPIAGDGIQSLSGYLQIAGTTGEVQIKETIFGSNSVNCVPLSGAGNCQSLGGKVHTLLGDRYFRSLPTDGATTGITVPSINVGFNLPGFTVTGQRLTQAVAENVSASIPWLPIAAPGSCPSGSQQTACQEANAQLVSGTFDDDILRVLLTEDGNTTTWPGCGIGLLSGCRSLVEYARFKMANGSAITDLNLDITFKQSLSMFHNIPLRGSGGYLSLQGQDVHWPGANVDDIAQKGWWMSFKEPIDLGYLQAQQQVDVSEVLPQVAEAVTNSLVQGDRIDVSSLGDSIDALSNAILEKKLVIPLTGQTAYLTLENQQLKSQHITPNCWGTSNFC